MEIRAEEISQIIKEQIKDYDKKGRAERNRQSFFPSATALPVFTASIR
jgi:hypothetical protein